MYSGWNPALDLSTAVERIPQSELLRWFGLIAVVDSSANINELITLPRVLEDLGASLEHVGQSALVDGPTLIHLNAGDFFSGFDELWLFRERPAQAKPEGRELFFTSDTRRPGGPPERVERWFLENKGVAGLGDGDGLNWITPDPKLAPLWDGDGQSEETGSPHPSLAASLPTGDIRAARSY